MSGTVVCPALGLSVMSNDVLNSDDPRSATCPTTLGRRPLADGDDDDEPLLLGMRNTVNPRRSSDMDCART